MLVSGALLPSRGAIFPALKSIGLDDVATRRAWAAFRKGAWQMPAILILWREHVKALPGWQEHRYEGYLPVTIDVTTFWHPALKRCPGKHYHPAAIRALPAVIFGIIGEVGKSMDKDWPCRVPSNECIPKTTARSACGRRCSKMPKKVSSRMKLR